MAFLELKNIKKSFGDAHIIKGVDLAIDKGEFIVFVGPSGCGKSTLLRLIAGLEPVSSGQMLLDGRDITYAPSGKRDLAMVFQSYALYPHMSVYDNMSFALKLAKVPEAEIRQKVEAAAAKLNLGNYLQRTPRSCPGASASAWPSAAPSCVRPRSSSSMSRCPTLTRPCAATRASRSRSCTSRSAPPRST